MLRFAIALIAGVVTSGAAESTDRALLHHRGPRATVGLPAGLPRPHYNFRTTITLSEPYAYPRPWRRLSVYEALPLSPGYDGSSYTYTDQEPYLGGPYVSHWDRLPYACGVYGYC